MSNKTVIYIDVRVNPIEFVENASNVVKKYDIQVKNTSNILELKIIMLLQEDINVFYDKLCLF